MMKRISESGLQVGGIMDRSQWNSRDILNLAIIKSTSTYNDWNVETSLRGITRWSFKVACKDDWTVTEKYSSGGDDRVIVNVGTTVVPG